MRCWVVALQVDRAALEGERMKHVLRSARILFVGMLPDSLLKKKLILSAAMNRKLDARGISTGHDHGFG